MGQERHLVGGVKADQIAGGPPGALSRRRGSESRPSSSTGSRGNRSISASAKNPRPFFSAIPDSPYTLTRSIPQLGESFFNT
jgi:hypothetical protein